MGIPEGEEREKGTESLFNEIIAENFPNLGKKTDIQIFEANRTPCYLNAKKTFSSTHYNETVTSTAETNTTL